MELGALLFYYYPHHFPHQTAHPHASDTFMQLVNSCDKLWISLVAPPNSRILAILSVTFIFWGSCDRSTRRVIQWGSNRVPLHTVPKQFSDQKEMLNSLALLSCPKLQVTLMLLST